MASGLLDLYKGRLVGITRTCLCHAGQHFWARAWPSGVGFAPTWRGFAQGLPRVCPGVCPRAGTASPRGLWHTGQRFVCLGLTDVLGGAGAGKRHGAPASTSERLWGHRLCRVLCVATRMSSAGVPCCLTDCNSLSGNHGTPVGHAPCHLRGAHSTLLMRIQCADSWFPSNRQVLTPDTT